MRNSRTCIVVLTFLALTGVTSLAPAQAPPGWRTFAHPKTGVKLFHDKAFKVTPVQPDEHLVLGTFNRKTPYKAKKNSRTRRPERFIAFVLDDVEAKPKVEKKQPEIRIGGSGTGTSGSGKKPAKPGDKIKNFEDIAKLKNAIHTADDFLKRRYRGWKKIPTKKRMRDGEKEYQLVREKPARNRRAPSQETVGYLYVRKTQTQTWGIVGFCDDKVQKYFFGQFRKIGRSLSKPKGFVRVRDNSSSFYKNKDLKGIPFRVKARQAMVKGWKAKDTKNFFVLYHTKNMKIVNKIVNDLEAVQPHYAAMFPPIGQGDAVSVVRICKDAKEYSAYGGPRGSAGYWNPAVQELVFYDATKDSGTKSKKMAEKDSYIVLYHEGFHQFIFNGLDRVSPDYWFNEGMADYFSGCVFYRGSTRLKEIDPSRWRIPRVKATVDSKRWIPLKRLIAAKRAEFYNPAVMGQMYAQAWSLVYFLLRSDEAAKQQGWREIVPRYYQSLSDEARAVKKKVTENTSLNDKMKLYSAAGTKSTKAAFKGVDMKRLEASWKQWIRTMKDPWASQRKQR